MQIFNPHLTSRSCFKSEHSTKTFTTQKCSIMKTSGLFKAESVCCLGSNPLVHQSVFTRPASSRRKFIYNSLSSDQNICATSTLPAIVPYESLPLRPLPPNTRVENVVVVGSGPAGYTAAIYLGRANLKPVVLEGLQHGRGGQLMGTTEVENFPGFPHGVDGPDLMERMRQQAARWGSELFTEDVDGVDLSSRPFRVLTTDREVFAHAVVLATGASAKRLRLPREPEFWSRGISACAICDGASPLFKKRVVAVVGGGDSAVEEALYLTKYASTVHLLVRGEKLRASRTMTERAAAHPQIQIHYSTAVQDVFGLGERRVPSSSGGGGGGGRGGGTMVSSSNSTSSGGDRHGGEDVLGGLRLIDRTTGRKWILNVRGLFYGIGHQPNTDLVKGQVDLDVHGYVRLAVPHGAATSKAGVFAAGDVADREWRQAITAAGSGCKSALSVERFLSEHGLIQEFERKEGGKERGSEGERDSRRSSNSTVGDTDTNANNDNNNNNNNNNNNSISHATSSTAADVSSRVSPSPSSSSPEAPSTPPASSINMEEDKHVGQYALRKLYHETKRPLIVMYTAPSCGPCRALKPLIRSIIDEFKSRIHFVEINIAEDGEIAEAAGVTGTPTIQVFLNKERLQHLPGVRAKSAYRDVIEEALAAADDVEAERQERGEKKEEEGEGGKEGLTAGVEGKKSEPSSKDNSSDNDDNNSNNNSNNNDNNNDNNSNSNNNPRNSDEKNNAEKKQPKEQSEKEAASNNVVAMKEEAGKKMGEQFVRKPRRRLGQEEEVRRRREKAAEKSKILLA